MKTATEQMAFYEAYHKHPLNKATHFIGIPLIIYALLIPMGWLRIPLGDISITGAMIFVFVVMIYYFILEATLAVGMLLFILPILYFAHLTALQPFPASAGIFLLTFFIGWIFQFIGHIVWEKRQPAFTKNLFQLIIGPFYICAEVYYLLGFKKALQYEIKQMEMNHAP